MQITQSQIGVWLAHARARAGFSQRKAGEHLDTDGGTVSRWENGRQPMSAESFFALVRLYAAEAELPGLVSGRKVYHTPRGAGVSK